MAEETIVADELDVQDQEETEDVEINTDVETDDEKELLKAQLAKAEADKEKWEARYKSTKKQEASKPKETKPNETKEVDLDSLVERKLAAMEEQRDFIKNYGQETYDAVKAIKEKHPTLSLEDAYKISPIANDPASKSNPDTSSM